MGHTPYGYRIENGCAVIDEEAAGKIRRLYTNYLAGMSQAKAAIEAGIETYHSSAKRLMQNRHYLGCRGILPAASDLRIVLPLRPCGSRSELSLSFVLLHGLACRAYRRVQDESFLPY